MKAKQSEPNTPKLPDYSEPMKSIRSLLERHKSKEDTEWVSQRLFDIFIVELNKSKSGIIAQELVTLKAQVRKEIEELRAADGTNGKLNVYLDSDGFWQMTDHKYHNQAITDCLSIPSLKEEEE